jgi:hypothetical protein
MVLDPRRHPCKSAANRRLPTLRRTEERFLSVTRTEQNSLRKRKGEVLPGGTPLLSLRKRDQNAERILPASKRVCKAPVGVRTPDHRLAWSVALPAHNAGAGVELPAQRHFFRGSLAQRRHHPRRPNRETENPARSLRLPVRHSAESIILGRDERRGSGRTTTSVPRPGTRRSNWGCSYNPAQHPGRRPTRRRRLLTCLLSNLTLDLTSGTGGGPDIPHLRFPVIYASRPTDAATTGR